MDHIRSLLKQIGVEEERIEIHQISASEGKQFADIITKFTDKIKEIGESKVPKKTVEAEMECT